MTIRMTPDEWESAYNPFQAYPCVAPCGCRMIQEPIEHPVKAWRLVVQVPPTCHLDSAKIGKATDSVRYEAATCECGREGGHPGRCEP